MRLATSAILGMLPVYELSRALTKGNDMTAATNTSTVTVNAAFLQEIKEVNQEMWDGFCSLESMCSRPMSLKDHCFELTGRLSDLRDQLALHFALEEAYGYFDEPEDAMPGIAERASSLRGQHRTLYQEFDLLVEQAETLLYERRLAALTTVIPVAFDQFAARFRQHEAEESALLQEVWTQDTGVGD